MQMEEMLYTVEYTLQPLQPTKNPDFSAALSVIAYMYSTYVTADMEETRNLP